MSHPCRFDLERLLAGELKGEERERISAHVDQCTRCGEWLQRCREEQEALLARLPAASFALRVETRARSAAQESRRWLWGWAWKTALAGAAGLLILLVWVQARGPGRATRWMGSSTACQIYVQEAGGVTRLVGDALRPGERVRFQLTLPADQVGYAALLGKQGERVFALVPDSAEAAALPVSGVFWMPGSLSLDGAGAPVELLLYVRSAPYAVAALIGEVAQDPRGAAGLTCRAVERRAPL